MIYTVLALAVLLLAIVPVGTAAFVLGFIYGESPCVLCWEQRIGMALIALVGLFVLRYGPRPKYVGAGVLVGAWGVFMGLRHMSLHAARDIGQGFALEIMGLHTYTWSFFIFWISVLTMAALLMLVKERDRPEGARTFRWLDSLAAVIFLVVIAGNIVQAFASTGPPPYVGQSDPVRFSFAPSNWVWSLEEWSSAPISLRGRWSVEKPAVPDAASAASGPIGNLTVLAPREQKRLGFSVDGSVTDLAYESSGDRFLVTTEHGVYISDGALSRVIRKAVVDPGFSVDLGRFAGTAFVDAHTIMAVTENKSYVVLRENDRADARKNFRFFLDSANGFDEVSRSRLTTVRARMMYVMSAAYDPSTKSVFTMTVPNSKVKRYVVSRFIPDPRDPALTEEYTPSLASNLSLSEEKRSLAELYITGATFADGRLYALDAAFGSVLTIDPASRTIVAAQAVSGLNRPVGLAIKGPDIYIVDAKGTIVVVGR